MNKAKDALKAGEGIITKTIKEKDGSITYATVYGDVKDGWDHILNIFIDSDSFSKVRSAAFKGKLKRLENKGDSHRFKGRQITIDTTDAAETYILKIDSEGMSLAEYARDTQKNFSMNLRNSAWKWAEFGQEDGTIVYNRDQLLKDKDLTLAVVLQKLAAHLAVEGYVEELRKINRYARAGVIVSAKDEDNNCG